MILLHSSGYLEEVRYVPLTCQIKVPWTKYAMHATHMPHKGTWKVHPIRVEIALNLAGLATAAMTSPSAAPFVAAAALALTLLGVLLPGGGDAVYYRRRPNYYITSPYQRHPIFTSYQHVPPRIDQPIVAMVKSNKL